MHRRIHNLLRCGLLGMLSLFCGRAAASGEPFEPVSRPPRLSPDYSDLILPPNIAPLNFKIEEPGTRFRVRIQGTKGAPFEAESRKPVVQIPVKTWRRLLQDNAGTNLLYAISVRDDKSRWMAFQTFTNAVATDLIDGYLAYRVIKPMYNSYLEMGTYQRNLSTFEQSVVITNSSFNHGCINCHTFLNHNPQTMLFQARSPNSGNPMLLIRSNQITTIMNTSGYLSWHPSGRLVAYSANKLSMVYHTVGETREVYDAKSDLGFYRVDQNRVVVLPSIARADRQETWPSWSPDGKYLYFCSGPVLPPERSHEIRYDLMRIAYDIDTDHWGEPEMIVSSAKTGLSCAQPRVSPDGRYLLFCMFKYGSFALYLPSDLYLLDLTTGRIEHPDINSPEPEGWHCWSTNGRWIVFSSKRRDGLFTRPYFSWFDAAGHFSKPFILPQEDPEFYDEFVNSFNLPELIQEPIRIPERDLVQAILNPKNVLRPERDTNGIVLAPAVVEGEKPQ